jgi:bacterioferritin
MNETNSNLGHGFDIAEIRRAAANLEDGAVTEGYAADREAVIAMLNAALATELLCVLRYKRHYFTVSGPNTGHIKAEFLEHAQQEQEHADQLAERIVQLNGSPNFNPATLAQRSHAEYDDSEDVQAMVRADLILSPDDPGDRRQGPDHQAPVDHHPRRRRGTRGRHERPAGLIRPYLHPITTNPTNNNRSTPC